MSTPEPAEQQEDPATPDYSGEQLHPEMEVVRLLHFAFLPARRGVDVRLAIHPHDGILLAGLGPCGV